MNFIKKIMAGLFSILLLISIGSCNESGTNTKPSQKKQPAVPVAQSMALDLSIFGAPEADTTSAQNKENYLQAYSTIRKIQAINERSISPSQKFLQDADTADARKAGNNKWEWNYSGYRGQKKYKVRYNAKLTATQQDDARIAWKFYLNGPQSNGENQLFFSGTTNQDVTQGKWNYYSFSRIAQPQKKVATLDWKIDKNGNSDLMLSMAGGNTLSGSSLAYHTEDATRRIILTPNSDNETTIEFNADTNAGFIKAPDFNNGAKACWNADFENISCSEN